MKQENRQSVDAVANPGYWQDKEACWIMLGCPTSARRRCDAFLHPQMPCWEQRATLCEEVLRVPKNCMRCIVYKAYHYQDAADESAYPE